MNPRLRLSMSGLMLVLILVACAPKAPAQATVDPNVMSTAIAQAAASILTETAAAYSPTPAETDTPTPSPTPEESPTPAVVGTPKPPTIGNFTGCWYGPGPTYTLESNITKGKHVQVLGVGSVAGWFIIVNPYFHKPCWVQAADLENAPTDLSTLPVMTPGPK